MKTITMLAITLFAIQCTSTSLIEAGRGGGHHRGHGGGHHGGGRHGGYHHGQNREHHHNYHQHYGHNRPYGHWRRYGDVGLGLGLGVGAAGVYATLPWGSAPYATTATASSASNQSVSNTYVNQPSPTNTASSVAEMQRVYVLNNTPSVLFVQTDSDEDTLQPGDSTDLNWSHDRLISYTSPDGIQKGETPISTEKIELIPDEKDQIKAQSM